MMYAAFLLAAFVALLVVYIRFPSPVIETKKRYAHWKAGLSRRVVPVDNHRWVYLAGGKGEAVLFIHGFGGDKDRWAPFLTPFDRNRYRVVVPDLPGFGESSRFGTASYDVPSQTNRLHRFVQAINLKSFHLAGVSMGGNIAGYYATKYPDQVKSLTLIGAAGVRSPEPSDRERFQRQAKRNILIVHSLDQFIELNAFLYHHPPQVSAPVLNYYARQAMAGSVFNSKVYDDLLKTADGMLEDRLTEIVAPTLVLWGAKDRVFHVSCAGVFQNGILNCRTVIIENCGHLPYLEKPSETREAFWSFIEKVKLIG